MWIYFMEHPVVSGHNPDQRPLSWYSELYGQSLLSFIVDEISIEN